MLILASVGVTVWLGIKSASPQPPKLGESAVYVLFASILQVAGGYVISRIGRADPTHARSAVRRLIQIGSRAGEARRVIESVVEQIPAKHQNAVGQVSVHLSYLEEIALDATEDWKEFHDDALRKVLKGQSLARERSK